MAGDYSGENVNAILDATRAMSDDGDVQLSILARALITGCQSCGVSQERCDEILAGMWAQPVDLVPIRRLTN